MRERRYESSPVIGPRCGNRKGNKQTRCHVLGQECLSEQRPRVKFVVIAGFASSVGPRKKVGRPVWWNPLRRRRFSGHAFPNPGREGTIVGFVGEKDRWNENTVFFQQLLPAFFVLLRLFSLAFFLPLADMKFFLLSGPGRCPDRNHSTHR